jgi:hypothetical protein
MHLRHTLALAVAAAVAATAPAQNLELDVQGGSLPGLVSLDAWPGATFFEPIMIVPSTNAGPTPCQLFDVNDFRSLDVGLELLSLAWAGLSGLDGHYRVQFAVPASPSLQDVPLHFQAVTFQFAFTVLDRISNPNAIRLGVAGSFRDRAVYSQFDRAFATVIQRPDRKPMLVGGARGLLLAQQAWATTEVYNIATDTFAAGPTMTTPRSLHTCTRLPNGQWLLTGGVQQTNDPQASCELYDPATDSFVATAPMGTPRTGHTATLLPNGKVLVTGGIQAMPVTPTQLQPIREIVNSTEIYDPATGAWTAGPNMSTPRAGHSAIVRPNGQVALVGGISWDANLLFGWLPAVRRSIDLYNPTTNTIAVGPQMATARSLIDPVDLGGDRWLFAGGINGITIIPFNPGNPTAAAEIYNAAANTWTAVGAMATARGNHRGWALGNGRFLLAGGANGSILSPTPLASTEVFDPATNLFTPGPAMSVPRAGAAETTTHQGQIQVFGGGSTGGTITASTEWWYF